MRLLDRYLLRELLVPLGYCLCGFLLLWITSDLFVTLSEFQRKGLAARDVAEYYLVVLPDFLVLVLPIALLLALLYALTNHARHQEITAIRAAGVSLWRLSLPYFGVGLLASLTLFAANEFWVPQSDDQAKAILKRHAAADPRAPGRNEYRDLYFESTRDGRHWRAGLYNTENGNMTKVGVYPVERGGAQPWELRAEHARRVDGVWTFYDVRVFKEATDTNMPPVPTLHNQCAGSAGVQGNAGRDQQRDQDQRKQDAARGQESRRADQGPSELHALASTAPALRPGLVGNQAGGAAGRAVDMPGRGADRHPVWHNRGPAQCVRGRGEQHSDLFQLFRLQQLGLALGTSGRMPPWLAAWFPNLSFGLAGLFMTARVR